MVAPTPRDDLHVRRQADEGEGEHPGRESHETLRRAGSERNSERRRSLLRNPGKPVFQSRNFIIAIAMSLQIKI